MLNLLSIRKYIPSLGIYLLTLLLAIKANSQSLYFNGIDSQVESLNPVNLNPTGFSISFWIKPESSLSQKHTIISCHNASFDSGYELILNENNQIEFNWSNDLTHKLVSNTTIPNGKWHQIAAIYDGTVLKLFVDGVFDSSQERPGPKSTESYFLIGKNNYAQEQSFFKGYIDEIRIWNKPISIGQLRLLMNQELENYSGSIKGKETPLSNIDSDMSNLSWTDILVYIPVNEASNPTQNLTGIDFSLNTVNINYSNNHKAPLPYISKTEGNWTDINTWSIYDDCQTPSALSIVDNLTPIEWNIAHTNHNITIQTEVIVGTPISLQSLVNHSNTISINGNYENSNGNGLIISHYLKLDGVINLNGESQLILKESAQFDMSSTGHLEKELQGTADNFTYNYWSSPVGFNSTLSNNNDFTVNNIIHDGELPVNFISSGYDGSIGDPVGIADYWIWKFTNHEDFNISAWQHLRKNGSILAGEGFTMKGPGSGSYNQLQKYTFKGKPNNGLINLQLSENNDLLVGNPYPSAIDANQFIADNSQIIFNEEQSLTKGTIYFWEHWANGSHNNSGFRGGYATYNLSGGVAAPSFGTNDANLATGGIPNIRPSRYIQPGKGFFVSGVQAGQIEFNNSQRIYKTSEEISEDDRPKLRIGLYSAGQIHRQLLLTIDENASIERDNGFDAELFNQQLDDCYWLIDDEKYNIQGSNTASVDTVYPIGVKINTSGSQTIALDELVNFEDDTTVFIHDKENNTYHEITSSNFSFSLPNGTYSDRFELTFSNEENSTLNTESQTIKDFDIFYNHQKESLTIINKNSEHIIGLNIYNLLGQRISALTDISDRDYSEYPVKNLVTGTYIVNLDTVSGSVSKKIFVQ